MKEKYINKIKKYNIIYEMVNVIKKEYKVTELEAYKILSKDYKDIVLDIINEDVKEKNFIFILSMIIICVITWMFFELNIFYCMFSVFLIVYSIIKIKIINLENNLLKLKKEFENE